jgi:hypothetical protein
MQPGDILLHFRRIKIIVRVLGETPKGNPYKQGYRKYAAGWKSNSTVEPGHLGVKSWISNADFWKPVLFQMQERIRNEDYPREN